MAESEKDCDIGKTGRNRNPHLEETEKAGDAILQVTTEEKNQNEDKIRQTSGKWIGEVKNKKRNEKESEEAESGNSLVRKAYEELREKDVAKTDQEIRKVIQDAKSGEPD